MQTSISFYTRKNNHIENKIRRETRFYRNKKITDIAVNIYKFEIEIGIEQKWTQIKSNKRSR